MCSWKAYAALLLGVALLVPLVLSITPPGPIESGPRNVEDVLRIARQLGWHSGSDRFDGVMATRRLILSQSRLAVEEINLLVYGRGENDAWIGKVAVYNGAFKKCEGPCLTDNMFVWGDFLLYGDARMIQTLINFTDCKQAE